MKNMKKAALIFIVFIFTFVGCLGANSLLKSSVRVNRTYAPKHTALVIDAGHGGIDAGTIGVDGAKEKTVNLGIAKKLYDFACVSGISASLIRDGDYLYYSVGDDKTKSDLYNRMDYINSVHNATLISIHQNHFEDEREHGMQIWYSPNDSKSPVLADKILAVTKSFLQPDNERLNKKSDDSYYLLYRASVPSVMVECGFMSNADENKKLQDENYQKKLAYAILLGLSEYITEETEEK